MNYKKIIVTVIMIHLLCQCTLNNRHYERVATELKSSDIDQSLINIIKLYIKKNPNIESVALYFNNEIDEARSKITDEYDAETSEYKEAMCHGPIQMDTSIRRPQPEDQ